jgi:hypothetical protein
MSLVITPEFQDNVRKWVLIDNKIKAAQDAVRILKKEKANTGNYILEYMKRYKLSNENINITGGKLGIAVSKRSVPINKEYIERRLTEYFNNEAKAKEIVEFIYADRETVQTETLRRTNQRQKK